MAQDIPDWATVGATAYVRPYTYGRTSVYREAVITRVTKASVFVKVKNATYEQRFVPVRGSWFKDEKVMEEYGQRSGWSHPAYLFAADSETVSRGLVASTILEAYTKAVRVLADFTANNPTEDRKLSAEKGIAALQSYLETLKLQKGPEDL